MSDSDTATSLKNSIKTENVVASSGIGKELELEDLSTKMPGADYDPDNFPGLVYRIMEPKMAALIFRSGKVVCTGANSIEDVEKGLEKVVKSLRDAGVEIDEKPEPVIQNIVSSADLGQALNLNAIAIGLGLEDVEYEPEQFPGLVYRIKEQDVVTLLFGSGKVVITGGKDTDDAERALELIYNELKEIDMID